MDRKQHWERLYTGKSPLEVSWYHAEPLLSLKLIEERSELHHTPGGKTQQFRYFHYLREN
jgi:hypothetical protein